MRKRITKILTCISILVLTLCLYGVPALAKELTDSQLVQLEATTKTFMETIMKMSDEQLEQITSMGDFYAKAKTAIMDNKKDLGDFVKIDQVTSTQSDGFVTITFALDCSKYDAEGILTYNVADNAPTDLVINPILPLSVNLINAGRNTVIGIGIVFAILIVLSFVISLFKYINPDARKHDGKIKEKEDTAVIPAKNEDDCELIAVCAAALMAADTESPTDTGYRVKSIRKISKNWKHS